MQHSAMNNGKLMAFLSADQISWLVSQTSGMPGIWRSHQHSRGNSRSL